MFKLIKILNTGVNVPEPEQLPCETNLALDAGACVIYDSASNKIYSGDQTETPTHVLIKESKPGDSFALCYRISPDMIFEVPITGNPEVLRNGMSVELSLRNGHGAYAISDIADGPAKIYSLEGATKPGDKVLVTFNV